MITVKLFIHDQFLMRKFVCGDDYNSSRCFYIQSFPKIPIFCNISHQTELKINKKWKTQEKENYPNYTNPKGPKLDNNRIQNLSKKVSKSGNFHLNY